MKLLYATSLAYPSRKANRVQVREMARAFAKKLGDDFTLGVRAFPEGERPMRTIELPGTQFSPVLAWKYARQIARGSFTHIYCREDRLITFLTWYLALIRRPTPIWFEVHDIRPGPFFTLALASAQGIVAISRGIKDELVRSGVPERKIVVAHDGVDVAAFAHPATKEAAREKLSIPLEAKAAFYIGRLDHEWKGTHTLFDAAELMDDVRVFVVGEGEEPIASLAARYPAVTFFGYRPYEELSDIMAAADALVLPNTGKELNSSRLTSPLKLFAYMTSNRPIVASDVPAVREVLDETTAYLVPPDDPVALAGGIRRALANPPEAARRALSARAKVEGCTWDARADAVLAAISHA